MEKKESGALIDSEKKLTEALLRLLRFANVKARSIISVFGIKQKCLLVDKHLFSLRPDLMLTGRALVGNPLLEGEEALRFISKDSRRNAVFKEAEKIARNFNLSNAKGLLEEGSFAGSLSASFEKGSVLIEKIGLLKEALSQAAVVHDFVCLFHEKPFEGIQGLGIDLQMSWKTENGLELLDHELTTKVLKAAIFKGFHRHAPLIWATIASAGNNLRLEPSFMIPRFSEEFEFFGVGTEEDLPLALTVLQTIIAQSLQVLLDDLEKKEKTWVFEETIDFSEQKKSHEAHSAWLEAAAEELFEGIFSAKKLQEIHDFFIHRYAVSLEREARVLIDLFRTIIAPACGKAEKAWADSLARINEVERVLGQTEDLGWEAKAKVLAELIIPKMEAAKEEIDRLETIVPSWPLPKYRELLIE